MGQALGRDYPRRSDCSRGRRRRQRDRLVKPESQIRPIPNNSTFYVGPDGDTRLGRCIKEQVPRPPRSVVSLPTRPPLLTRPSPTSRYHISRASDASELPTWLFTPAELAARAARSAAAARAEAARDERDYERDYERPNRRSQAQDAYSRPAARRRSVEEFQSFRPDASAAPIPSSGSRATDRLRAMREAKKAGRG